MLRKFARRFKYVTNFGRFRYPFKTFVHNLFKKKYLSSFRIKYVTVFRLSHKICYGNLLVALNMLRFLLLPCEKYLNGGVS